MTVKTLIKTSEYHDSVTLMLVARELTKMVGVLDAAVVMATEANKSLLKDAGLLTAEIEKATPNDLVIAIKMDGAASDTTLGEAATLWEASMLGEAEKLLNKKQAQSGGTSEHHPRTIRSAVKSHPEANVAIISVSGRYAADEAWEALRQGLHVLLFSDNVSLEDEIDLKRYARDHGLLLMGPGAGTAILNGAALAFANVIPSGPVGIVSAAGTGLQEVSSLLARYGAGITQGIGTGGRDLTEEVGGIMMLEGLKALQADPATQVIAVVSKPPALSVARKILDQVASSPKPTVVCFMGGDPRLYAGIANVQGAATLQETAYLAAKTSGATLPDLAQMLAEEERELQNRAASLKVKLTVGQSCLRGLFSGGTLCYEAQVIWQKMGVGPVYSNAPLPSMKVYTLPDSTHSQGHTIVDLGEEEFTVGRPHPMIDNDLRIRRLLQEGRDSQVAVIFLDVVLGYGSHLDPASELGPAIAQARQEARQEGRELLVVASITGTDGDPQGLKGQAARLEQAGATICSSNAAAARLAGMLVKG